MKRMKIAILGYGRMGKEIEQIAVARGHEVVLKMTEENRNEVLPRLSDADAAIEFSQPGSAISNIEACFSANVPVVVGTTGWYDHFDSIATQCKSNGQALFTATNFSLGVNLFFEMNRQLAKLMNPHTDYEVSMEEIHHVHKLDSPSGTAITIAEGLIDELDSKASWTEDNSAPSNSEINIISSREGEVPGTHVVHYNSEIDHIEIKHEAHNRKGFALGSVLAAEWIQGKKGVFTMKDLLNLN
jgi:4-hydroxy-tetrahydrodipicolinate reductase